MVGLVHVRGNGTVLARPLTHRLPVRSRRRTGLIGWRFNMNPFAVGLKLGLAVALIFGILVSTVLTLVVIPLLYYAQLAPREPGPQAP